mmetsp:Transcript_16579/g.49508  ORF Transcript_16579/g.49508 Transcript_16579/m.49508 type:complete len:207 (-) Transcript_16579:433-1053(-)
MTASAPVASRHRSRSSKSPMPPFAITTMPGSSASRTVLIASQDAAPESCLFWRRVRPCTHMRPAPASTRRRQWSIVLTKPASSGSRRTLQEAILCTPSQKRSSSARTTLAAASTSRSRSHAPYRPFRAMFCGQPRFTSSCATFFACSPARASTSSAALQHSSGSLPATCTQSGPSSASVWKWRSRYCSPPPVRPEATPAWIIGVYA